MKKVVHFDSFYTVCPWFDGRVVVNNGYGCNHPRQEETDFDETLEREQGKCYCWSCPLGNTADKESLSDPDVDWSDISDNRDDICISEDGSDTEYLIVNCGGDAAEDEKNALDAYTRYVNRYLQ